MDFLFIDILLLFILRLWYYGRIEKNYFQLLTMKIIIKIDNEDR